VAFLLGLAAVGAAMVAARGPAVPEEAVYTWPPAVLPTASPTRAWVGPLLLARHEAAAIDADVPCHEVETLAGAGGTTQVLATARRAVPSHALEVRRSAFTNTTVVRVGNRELVRVLSTDPKCALHLQFIGRAWTIRGPGSAVRHGTLAIPPAIDGFYSELNLERKPPPIGASIRPIVQDTRPSVTQTVFRVATILLLVGAVLVLVRPRRPRVSLPRLRWAGQDTLVAAALGVWWLLAPLQDDDGWVRARETNYLVSGGFSNYYEHWGANLPLATWWEWIQHLVVANSESFALHRIPSVVLLAATWLTCRWCLAELLGRGPSAKDPIWWSAALTFVVGSSAFGMTLRPEPAIALLAVGVLACCLRYARAPRLECLILSVVLAGLAVTIHPAGLVAAGPLVVTAPRAIRDVRHGRALSPAALAALSLIGLAWALLLAYLDSDLAHRREDASLIRGGGGHEYGALEEFQRYGRLSDWGGSPLRRELVVLALLAVLGLVASRHPRRNLAERLPSLSIALALFALAFAPSKWIWHFGTLMGLCAVAVGFELHRLATTRVPPIKHWGAALLILLASVWASSDPNGWGPLDTGRLNWSSVPFAELVVASAVVVLGVVYVRRRPSIALPEVVILPVALGSLLAVTALGFALDSIVTHGWTPARQVLSTVSGRQGCGLADDLVIPRSTSIRELRAVGDSPDVRAEAGSPPATPGLVLTPSDVENRWFHAPRAAPIGVFVGGEWRGTDRLVVTWGNETSAGIRRLRTGAADLRQAVGGSDFAQWRFIGDESFPKRPAGADTIRVRLAPATGSSSDARATRPVSFARVRLGGFLRQPSVRSLVSPYLFAALPCAKLPPLAFGAAGVPSILVDWIAPPSATHVTGPFVGLSDLFEIVRLPVHAPDRTREQVQVYWVRLDPRDAIAPATRRVMSL
jgi:hypothetical protein